AECPPQIRQRIAHFASRDAMDIEGLGEKIVDQLVTEGLIQNYADLYKIDKEQLLPLDRMAEKSAQNLIDSIDQSREMPLDRLIYALGIRFVGKTVARDLAAAFETIHNLMEANEEQIAAIDAVGPTIAQSVSSFFNDPANVQMVRALEKAGLAFEAESNEPASQKLAEKTFVLTGSLATMTRNEATELIEKHGGKVTSSVSGNTDYLLAGESPGSKYEQAQDRDIPILTEGTFLDLIDEAEEL
ncbi:MAG TPA: helix-hairpin-helix domain-containing protein, partial [Fodinibius sp.]|nr:helix-hairpin-helix domain-containing protein [Fodinibius sp.]